MERRYDHVGAIDEDGQAFNAGIESLPDECPVCHSHMDPRPTGGNAQIVREIELFILLRCSRRACSAPFLAVYRATGSGGFSREGMSVIVFRHHRSIPWTIAKQTRAANVSAVSPNFYDLLDQASAAEQYELSEIAGPGYRKALEFLVKDYASRDARLRVKIATDGADAAAASAAQVEVETIIGMALANVIANKIADEDIRNMAARAAWLGNDETHYTRTWASHDLQDLKQLLSLAVAFIDRKEQARLYLEQMPKK